MFAHVQSVYDQPTGHLYTQMISRNPRRSPTTIYHINYPSSGFPASFLHPSTSLAHFLPVPGVSSPVRPRQPAARRKSIGVRWSRRCQQKLPAAILGDLPDTNVCRIPSIRWTGIPSNPLMHSLAGFCKLTIHKPETKQVRASNE